MTFIKSRVMGIDKDWSSLTPFHVLLGTISSLLSREDVRHIRVQLQGHLNKECLDRLRVGHHVTEVLHQRGLVTDKKLAFLRKLLIGCQQEGLVLLVDEFKKSSTEPDGHVKQGTCSIDKL
jgi:bacterioferritin (cytochrome b1)